MHHGWSHWDGFICPLEYIRLARIPLQFDSCDDPVSWAYNVSAFERINPSVIMHRVLTLRATRLAIYVWASKVSHNDSFTRLSWNLAGVFKWSHYFIMWMISVAEPLRCFNNDW